MLKEKEITEPTIVQLKDSTDKFEEELHATLFLYKTDMLKYGKFIKGMENHVLQRKDPFPKRVSDACRTLAGWKIHYGNQETRLTDMKFVTTGNEKKKGNKKKEVTCYKCGKAGHYSNECDEIETVKISNTSKKGSNFLVLNKDAEESSSEEEN